MNVRKIISVLLFLGCALPLLASADTWNVKFIVGGTVFHDTWVKQSGLKPETEYYTATRAENKGTYKLTMSWSGEDNMFAIASSYSWNPKVQCNFVGKLTDKTHASGTVVCGEKDGKAHDNLYSWTATIGK